MKHERKPAKATPARAAARVIKLLHQRHVKALGADALSLKAFARRLAEEEKFKCSGDERGDLELVRDWLHNKRASFKKPQLGIGKTTKKKGAQKK